MERKLTEIDPIIRSFSQKNPEIELVFEEFILSVSLGPGARKSGIARL